MNESFPFVTVIFPLFFLWLFTPFTPGSSQRRQPSWYSHRSSGLSQDVALGSIWLVPQPGESGLIIVNILFPCAEQGEVGTLH